MSVAIDVKDLWLRYREGDWILKGVNLRVLKGKTILIIGPSGGGKTSLARALTNMATTIFNAEVKGEITICSKPIQTLSTIDIQKCIQIVNQDPYIHFLEPIALDDLVNYAEKMYGDRASEVVDKVAEVMNIKSCISKPITSLSGGQLRRVAIAKVLIANPSIIILDEPLMWLDDVEGIELLYNVLSILKSLGKTVIVMEHRFLHLLDKVDEVYVLKNGVLYSAEELKKNTDTSGNIRVAYDKALAQLEHDDRQLVLELNNVWFKYEGKERWILKGVNLRVYQGDTVIIYGRNGSGKSTLLRIIAGVLRPSKGSKKVHREILYIPQIPYLFMTEDSVINEIKALCKSRKLDGSCINKGLELLKIFGYNDIESLPINLSWGQQTRLAVLLAYVVAKDGIILLDEPFTGSTYLDSFNIAHMLSSLRTATKIITLSSKDYIPLFRNTKIYTLEEGLLKPFDGTTGDIFKGVEIVQKLLAR